MGVERAAKLDEEREMTVTDGAGADTQAQIERMHALLETQRKAGIKNGPPSYETRIERLDRLIGLLVDHKDEICETLSKDFGHRNSLQSILGDIADGIGCAKYAKANLKKWMKPSKRHAEKPFGLFGAKAEVRYQPKGVIGIISPWNFPVGLTFNPLAQVLAAGNSALIKPSEFSPATSELMERMLRTAFDEEVVAVIPGGAEVGEAFSKLAFDHLVFTGATGVARHVMRAASENLVPVTLELGGKSPVIIGKGADMELAANRVMFGKTLNAGQICLAPDYVLVAEGETENFVKAATKAVTTMYPTLKDNPDYTSVVNQRHYERLNSYVDDAKAKGADVVEINPANEDFSQQPHHKIPPTLVVDPGEDTKIMQDEIFGPLLPVKTMKSTSDAINYINANDRPLGLYYFGDDEDEREEVLRMTTSGGVTLNDVIFHVSQHDMPFGGIGPAGMGSYHGEEGFREFSHARSVYKQIGKPFGKDLLAMIRPPYNEKAEKQFNAQVKR